VGRLPFQLQLDGEQNDNCSKFKRGFFKRCLLFAVEKTSTASGEQSTSAFFKAKTEA
jgi:hypothetical protein